MATSPLISRQAPAGGGHPAMSPDKLMAIARNLAYPEQLWWFVACFMAVVAIGQFASFVHSKMASGKAVADAEQPSGALRHGPSLRRLPLAIMNIYRVVAFRTTISLGQSYTLNLAEVFVAAAYTAALFTWAFINTTTVAGHHLDVGYWSNRAGVLAASQFPLLTALGTKNNIVSWITGVSYDKLNYLHRIMARNLMILLWVHAGSKIHMGIEEELGETFIRCGLLAVIALTLLCVLSLRPVRAGAYEVFFYAHFGLVLIFLVGAYVHTEEFNKFSKYNVYIWASMVIWGFDRVVRALRLVAFNHSYFGFSSGSGTLDANVELLSDHFVRLRLRRPPHFHWKPGQTAYLMLPSVSRLPLEAHPFTIASFESHAAVATPFGSTDEVHEKEKASEERTPAPYWRELVFLINVREGFTKRLKDAAVEKRTVKAFVDGPYGPSPDLSAFDSSVLIAGGTGVSYTLPVLLDIIERVKSGNSNCQRVTFIWSIRDGHHVSWISETLSRALELAPPSLQVSIRVFVTGSDAESLRKASGDTDNDSLHSDKNTLAGEEKDRKLALFTSPAYSVREGRPNLGELLMEEAAASTGRMSVSVCGSHGIAQAARNALKFPVAGPTEVMKGGPSITLHIESFGYA